MDRAGQVILIYVTAEVITSGLLQRLAVQRATLALVLLASLNNDDVVALRTVLPLLSAAPRVTLHREQAGFQQSVADVLKQHDKLDVIITEDGETVTRPWPTGSEEDKTQMLVYAAFTDMQARQLRRQLREHRG